MLEITCLDKNVLDSFIASGRLYRDAVYDFTFERRFHVYHIVTGPTIRYIALDSKTGYGSGIIERRVGLPLLPEEHAQMAPKILFSIKYTGDKRYAEYRR